MNEADTCRELILPKLQAAGWDTPPHSLAEQRTFTAGRVVVSGEGSVTRQNAKRADYILRYTKDFPIAVVEAKPNTVPPGTGLQQAKTYAEILQFKFAYATNGNGIIEFNYLTGIESELKTFPTPEDLWQRLQQAKGLGDDAAKRLLTPFHNVAGKTPRYYQNIAINHAVASILRGEKRVLLTMATGTGKTFVAFQICWKLWSAAWNAKGEARRPKILYLADRNILIDDPKDKMFLPFGDARHKIENGQAVKGREMYFAIYQAIAKDENRPGLYKEYAPDFFDLIIVDECHRGSARDDSNWREILEYYHPAFQLGMTATPLRECNRDTYKYFGAPAYIYSLRQGIQDGFLAPYRVHRVITTADAAGWRPSKGELDEFGREIPDGEYQTRDFERNIVLRKRTRAIARHLTDFLKKTDRYAKTIVFCVDQEHADHMRRELANCNADLVRKHPDYVCRVTSDEGGVGLGHLSRFQDLESDTPVILTTSKLLTTGVDAPMCKNVALVTVIGSMTDFKQIIGRGTRLNEEYGKLFFNILDYTGTATRHFADPDFDGEPEYVEEEDLEEEVQEEEEGETPEEEETPPEVPPEAPPGIPEDDEAMPRKFYTDGGDIDIATHLVADLDGDGKQLQVKRLTDFTAEKVRTLFSDATALRTAWADPDMRQDIQQKLKDAGIDMENLASQAEHPDADPFDLLCHLAFNAPLRTRKERAELLKRERKDFFKQFAPEARQILDELLEKYAVHGPGEFQFPDVLDTPPISEHGNVSEIIRLFNGADKLREAVSELQKLLYAA